MNSHGTYYWRVVHDCLVKMHGLDSAEAQRRVREFRLRLRTAPAEINTDLIFHDEPFALACRLIGQERLVPTEDEGRAYREILKQRAEEAAALGTDEEVRLLEGAVTLT
jgi:hypothetical protein